MEQPATQPNLDPEAVADFHAALSRSKRIVAVLGAGISAPSGLATFRDSGGLWQSQDVTQVASPAGFRHDPGLVWRFYSYRRREALRAEPNAAHRALAELARRVPGSVTLTQNIDGLSQRAGHPGGQLRQLHGSLFDLRCVDDVACGYVESGNFDDPLTPALDTQTEEALAMGKIDPDIRPKATPLLLAGIARKNAQILGDNYKEQDPSKVDMSPLKPASGSEGEGKRAATLDIRMASGLSKEDLPQCPKCKKDILRPGVVWFGEGLPKHIVEEADALFEKDSEPIDLCLVIGTSARVWPAAGYAELARNKGARIAVVNTNDGDARKNMRPGKDWAFVGDAAVVVPALLAPVVSGAE